MGACICAHFKRELQRRPVTGRTSIDLDVLAPLLVDCCNALVHGGQCLADQHLRSAHSHFAKPDLVGLDALLLGLRVAISSCGG